VEGWDTYGRSQLESGYWYTVIDPVTLRLTPDEPGQFRAKILSRGLAKLFEAAGLPAMSPHKSGAGAGNMISRMALFAPAPAMAMLCTVSCMRGTWPTSRR
jgi:hypothetical protein